MQVNLDGTTKLIPARKLAGMKAFRGFDFAARKALILDDDDRPIAVITPYRPAKPATPKRAETEKPDLPIREAMILHDVKEVGKRIDEDMKALAIGMARVAFPDLDLAAKPAESPAALQATSKPPEPEIPSVKPKPLAPNQQDAIRTIWINHPGWSPSEVASDFEARTGKIVSASIAATLRPETLSALVPQAIEKSIGSLKTVQADGLRKIWREMPGAAPEKVAARFQVLMGREISADTAETYRPKG